MILGIVLARVDRPRRTRVHSNIGTGREAREVDVLSGENLVYDEDNADTWCYMQQVRNKALVQPTRTLSPKADQKGIHLTKKLTELAI